MTVELILSCIALTISAASLWWASSCERRCSAAILAAAGKAFANGTDEPSREERIQRARAHIQACKGGELSLAQHADNPAAAIMLAQLRHNAAHARADLTILGIEP